MDDKKEQEKRENEARLERMLAANILEYYIKPTRPTWTPSDRESVENIVDHIIAATTLEVDALILAAGERLQENLGVDKSPKEEVEIMDPDGGIAMIQAIKLVAHGLESIAKAIREKR